MFHKSCNFTDYVNKSKRYFAPQRKGKSIEEKQKAYCFKRLESSFLCVAPALLFLGGAKFCVLSEQLSAVKVVFVVTTF